MTSPVPGRKERSVLPMLIAAALGLSLVSLAAVAVLPAHPPSPELVQLVVMHNALIAGRTQLDREILADRSAAPVLETSATGVLEGRRVESWLYRLERQAFTVHLLSDTGIVPRNASKLPLGQRRVSFFEVEDLQVIARLNHGGELLAVLGAGPLPIQLRLGRWIDSNGLTEQRRQ